MDEFKLPILIYDSECPLCVRFSQSIARINETGHVQSVPLQNELLYKKFEDLSRDNTEAELHLIDENGVILKGSKALSYLMKLSPKIRKIAWLVDSQMGQKTLDFFYNSANKYRESLRKHCPKCHKKKQPQI